MTTTHNNRSRPQPDPPAQPWVPGALLLICCSLTAILAGIIWRSSPAELKCAWPIRQGWTGWRGATLGSITALSGLSLILLAVAWRQTRQRGLQKWHFLRPWVVLITFYCVLFSYTWFLLPATAVDWNQWLMGGVFFLLALVIVIPRTNLSIRGQTGWLLTPYITYELLMLLLPVVVWFLFPKPIDVTQVVISVVTYPLYALLQLAVFLMLPRALLRQAGVPRWAIVLTCASLFALVHWPNTLVMIATFITMTVWTLAYLAGRNLLLTALVMGLLATSFTRGLPDTWTEHMKVGPGLVRWRTLNRLGGVVDPLAKGFDANVVDPVEFLTTIYPQILDREITPAELTNWQTALWHGLRCSTAYFIITGSDYSFMAAENLRGTPLTPGGHWTEAPAVWQHFIEYLASDENSQIPGANAADFYRVTWSRIFMKPYPMTSKPYISDRLSPQQCRRLVEVLHEHRHQWRNHPFETISDTDLLWRRH